jgi:hypothetical protein
VEKRLIEEEKNKRNEDEMKNKIRMVRREEKRGGRGQRSRTDAE